MDTPEIKGSSQGSLSNTGNKSVSQFHLKNIICILGGCFAGIAYYKGKISRRTAALLGGVSLGVMVLPFFSNSNRGETLKVEDPLLSLSELMKQLRQNPSIVALDLGKWEPHDFPTGEEWYEFFDYLGGDHALKTIHWDRPLDPRYYGSHLKGGKRVDFNDPPESVRRYLGRLTQFPTCWLPTIAWQPPKIEAKALLPWMTELSYCDLRGYYPTSKYFTDENVGLVLKNHFTNNKIPLSSLLLPKEMEGWQLLPKL
ncbi:MAG: hypothetical protein JSR80_03560 [Verrucomicrobia bacterium]|nr:hypothetical protein [Verrucomicrobiota bacterium]